MSATGATQQTTCNRCDDTGSSLFGRRLFACSCPAGEGFVERWGKGPTMTASQYPRVTHVTIGDREQLAVELGEGESRLLSDDEADRLRDGLIAIRGSGAS